MSVKDLKKKLNNILTKDESVDTIISSKSCLSSKVIPMPIYGIVISLMCFAVACQAFFLLEITCKRTFLIKIYI
jgi:hypothetical protein